MEIKTMTLNSNTGKSRKPILRINGRGPRPHVWKCGPDEHKHMMYEPWLRSKAQANFRNEEWTLTFDQYYEMWKDHWHERGRKSHQKCMSRIDDEAPWNKANTEIILRYDQLLKQARKRAEHGQRMLAMGLNYRGKSRR
jgi:hypothetical protein